jgi:CDP-glycerol glycerophosphotransferase (TagB/SpsB family)
MAFCAVIRQHVHRMVRARMKRIRYLARAHFIYLLMLPFDLIVPKRTDWWIFSLKRNYPWGDNLRSVFEEALRDPDIFPIILYGGRHVHCDIEAIYSGEKYAIAHRMSLKGIWYYLRSRYCLIGHNSLDLYSTSLPHARHVIVNLWHGVPIKAIAYAEPQSHGKHRFRRFFQHCHHVIANSPIDRLAMSACMLCDPKAVWMTGLPRNDLLFEDTSLYPDLQEEERRLLEIMAGRRLVLYAPTFRDWPDVLNPLSEMGKLEALSEMVRQQGAVLGIRKHPSDRKLEFGDTPHVIDCSHHRFLSQQILLRHTDVLITDYSSIWVDYLLLDKPVIGLCYDLERYREVRTFLYAFEDIFPGPITHTADELITTAKELLQGKDTCQDKRTFAKWLFMAHLDGRSAKRVVDKIKGL